MSSVRAKHGYDTAVVGAGVFGSWIARELQNRGQRVIILDAYGPANNRASSGGESRVIRCCYGEAKIYAEWALRSLQIWREFSERTQQRIFYQTGVLWLAGGPDDSSSRSSLETLRRLNVPHQTLAFDELQRRYPQIAFDPEMWGIYEPESGALIARRAVQALVEETIKMGGDYLGGAAVVPPTGAKILDGVATLDGTIIRADNFVFACGPWLPKLFPSVLAGRIHSTRQEVFFFGTPAGDKNYAPPQLPVWVDFGREFYGLPDLENRGLKIAFDRHGPDFDPDAGNRLTSEEALIRAREFMAKRFPALRDAPVVETRVCQYENTSSGDFLLDLHPDFKNVWLAGGGSGHGFKHGPAVGAYLAARITGEEKEIDERFSLSSKRTVTSRAVY